MAQLQMEVDATAMEAESTKITNSIILVSTSRARARVECSGAGAAGLLARTKRTNSPTNSSMRCLHAKRLERTAAAALYRFLFARI